MGVRNPPEAIRAQIGAIKTMDPDLGFGMLFTPQQVADIFQVRVNSVYRWIQEGLIPAVRLGGTGGYRIKAQAIRDYMEEYTV